MRDDKEIREAYELCGMFCNALARGQVTADDQVAVFYRHMRECLQWVLDGDPEHEGCQHSFDDLIRKLKRMRNGLEMYDRWNR